MVILEFKTLVVRNRVNFCLIETCTYVYLVLNPNVLVARELHNECKR